jgi:hypothetical protein
MLESAFAVADERIFHGMMNKKFNSDPPDKKTLQK